MGITLYHKKIFIVRRPGDFYHQVAALCALVDDDHLDKNKKTVILTDRESQFIDLSTLFKKHNYLEFAILPERHARAIKRQQKLHVGVHSLPEGRSVKINFNKFFALIREYAREVTSPFGHDDDTFKFFVALDLEKRKWINQKEILIEFIRKLNDLYGHRVTLINNGLTRSHYQEFSDFKSPQSDFEIEILNDISKETGCATLNLFGFNCTEKIRYIKYCDFGISSLGTGIMLPLALEIPTMGVGNHYLHDWARRHKLNRQKTLAVFPAEKTEIFDSTQNSAHDSAKFRMDDQLKSYQMKQPEVLNFLLSAFNKNFLQRTMALVFGYAIQLSEIILSLVADIPIELM